MPQVFLGGKLSTKSDIGTLNYYTKLINKSFQTGLRYDIEKVVDLFHWDINIIITMKYQYCPPLRALATAMLLEAVEIISDIFRWVEYTYKLLLTEVNVKEDIWWITTRIIRSIFEYYLSPSRSTSAKTSFDSDYC